MFFSYSINLSFIVIKSEFAIKINHIVIKSQVNIFYNITKEVQPILYLRIKKHRTKKQICLFVLCYFNTKLNIVKRTIIMKNIIYIKEFN